MTFGVERFPSRPQNLSKAGTIMVEHTADANGTFRKAMAVRLAWTEPGFTLIELLTVMVVLATLLTLALPAMGDMLARNAVTANAHAFSQAVNIARYESMRRGYPVTICPAADADSASPQCRPVSWSAGWLVFADRAAAGVFSADSRPLSVHGSAGSSVGISDAVGTPLTFHPSGAVGGVEGVREVEFSARLRSTVLVHARVCIYATGKTSVETERGCA
jgi:type IV fimbrial biogenesis protein FimT